MITRCPPRLYVLPERRLRRLRRRLRYRRRTRLWLPFGSRGTVSTYVCARCGRVWAFRNVPENLPGFTRVAARHDLWGVW